MMLNDGRSKILIDYFIGAASQVLVDNHRVEVSIARNLNNISGLSTGNATQ